MYFEIIGKAKQLIPNHIVDFGCDKFIYKSKTKKEKNITAHIIEIFDGKVVP